MKENYDYTEYNDEKNKVPWGRIGIIIAMLVITIIIALLLLRGCGKTDLNKKILEAGKDYYEQYSDLLPTEAGSCKTVNLSKLLEENLLKSNKNYTTCDKQETLVKVCKLESGDTHYVAILNCEVETSNFGMWAEGTEKDILADKTDIRFKFKGEELNLGVKYYYPKNLTELEKVTEYYASSPSAEYNGKEDEQTGYKWYTNSTNTTYWNNGEYSSTQPNGYSQKGESTTKSYTVLTEPTPASYRTVTKTDLYRSQQKSKIVAFMCYPEGQPNVTKRMEKPCSGQFPKLSHLIYSCDGVTEFNKEQECSPFTEWTAEKCTTNALTGLTCQSQTGYKYVDTLWKWYKTDNIKKYFPSGSASAAGEKTYYTSAPTAGAIKDDATGAKVNKYYKLVNENGSTSNHEEWLDVTGGYVTLNEMIEFFKSLGHNVETLSDIKKIETLRYHTQLEYRNIEK